MNIWKPGTIEEEPEVVLRQWQIYEVESELWPKKTKHFVGYNMTWCEGRVSSAIVEFNKDNMIGKTKSGRIYKLLGNKGFNKDADYVWNLWKYRNQITSCEIIPFEDIV